MSEQEVTQEEQEVQVAVSEQPEVEPQEQEGQKMVPLAALEAERKKRQEVEAKAQLYQDYLMRAKEEKAEEAPQEDPGALVERKDLQQTVDLTKREILETLYKDMKPEAVQMVNTYLDRVLEKKPWLLESVKSAQNRYARAYEIVQDYLHLVEDKPQNRKVSSNLDGQRIVQNSQKPRSPVEIGKSSQPGGIEYLKSVQGKKEFREYRQKVLRGEA